MSASSFSRLLQFLNTQLDLDEQLEVYDHLDQCDICRDAVYQLLRDRDGALFINCAHRVKPYVVRHHIDAAGGRLWADERKRACSHGGEQKLKPALLKGAQLITAPFGPGSKHTMWRI